MFNNITKVTGNNFSLVWRLMLYKIITFLICVGLFLGTVLPLINPVVKAVAANPDADDFFPALGAVAAQVLSGNYFTSEFITDYMSRLSDSMSAVGIILADNALNMVFAYVAAALIILILRFLFNFTNYAAAYSVNENMSSNARLGFAATVTMTLKPAFRFWLAYSLITLPYDIVLVMVLLIMLNYMLPVLGVFTMFFVILIAVALIAFRMTLFSFWMPEAIINGGKIFDSLKRGTKLAFNKFWKFFGGYAILAITVMALGIVMISSTFGAGLVVLLPFNSLLVIVYIFVSYYSTTRRSYYVNYDTIANPPADLDVEMQNYTIPEEEIQARMEELRKEREKLEKE